MQATPLALFRSAEGFAAFELLPYFGITIPHLNQFGKCRVCCCILLTPRRNHANSFLGRKTHLNVRCPSFMNLLSIFLEIGFNPYICVHPCDSLIRPTPRKFSYKTSLAVLVPRVLSTRYPYLHMHNIQRVIIHRSGSLTRTVGVTIANKTLISTVTWPDNKVYQKQPAVKTEAVTTAINFSQICGVDKEGAKTAEISSVFPSKTRPLPLYPLSERD